MTAAAEVCPDVNRAGFAGGSNSREAGAERLAGRAAATVADPHKLISRNRKISLFARETFTLSMKAKRSNISVETGGGPSSLRCRRLIQDGGGVSRTPPPSVLG